MFDTPTLWPVVHTILLHYVNVLYHNAINAAKTLAITARFAECCILLLYLSSSVLKLNSPAISYSTSLEQYSRTTSKLVRGCSLVGLDWLPDLMNRPLTAVENGFIAWMCSTTQALVSYPDCFRRLHCMLRNGVKWPADGWGLVYETTQAWCFNVTYKCSWNVYVQYYLTLWKHLG